jgi:ribosome biogenesis GTPase / thiamine phosphate phosphatase
LQLQELGWDESFADAFQPHESNGFAPARVAVEHRSEYVVYAEAGELRAELAGRLRFDGDHPGVGDWVAIASRADEGRATIQAVLPRRTAFVRKTAWAETKAQTVAANVDVVFIVCGLDLNFNLRRVERYLTLAWESGAQPVALLTKADLCEDVPARVLEVETIAIGVPVHAVSVPTGEGIDEVRGHLGTGRTGALLGSSGVGKSTLVNALVGEELLATREVRATDGRGRHTTSHRQLVLLPDGGLVLDTPGMRELQLWNADLEQTFGDVEEVARRCRFSDCAHDQEPGCAIRDALADGSLPRERWESYAKLQREMEAIEARRNHLLRLERVREHKIRARQNRQKKKH